MLSVCLAVLFSMDLHAQQEQFPVRAPDLRTFHVTQFTVYASVAADIATTWRGMGQGRTQANPLLGQSRVTQSLMAGGSTVAAGLLTHHLYNTGHRKLAMVLNVVATGEHAFAAWHNGWK
jgi:hypothetical protein